MFKTTTGGLIRLKSGTRQLYKEAPATAYLKLLYVEQEMGKL